MRFARLPVAALVIALAALASQPSRAEEELKIGGIGPLSGGGTAWGIALNRGAQMPAG
jgi:branched-chain amino acid transport system substrate-binding protein